jgi:predicted SAM-dependent methyltransferase
MKSLLQNSLPIGTFRALRVLRDELRIARRHRKGVQKARQFASSKGLKLNVGAGPNIKPGWVNIDFGQKADLGLDMREKLPFSDGACAIVYSEHFFEHLYYPTDAKNFLAESVRVLEKGGTFSAGVPDTEWPLRDYTGAGDGSYFRVEQKWNHPDWCKTRMEHINFHFRQYEEHKFAYDYETFEAILKEAGFSSVRHREFDPGLDTPSRKLGTLYVEATK